VLEEKPPHGLSGTRILVDKVMQPEGGWHTEEWMVAEAAAAGFNVWSPRQGNDDLRIFLARRDDKCGCADGNGEKY
jgi:hypothetical protein